MKHKTVIVFGMIILLVAVMFALNAPAAEPERFLLRFSDAYLVYQPSTGVLQIVTESNVLSYGNDWEVIQVYPYLYHMRLRTWSGFYWKVNTSRREVYEVTGGSFGSLGGSERPIANVTVDAVGTGDVVPPDRFFLRFSDSYLVYVPSSAVLQIIASNYVLSYGADWRVVKIYDYLYHMRQNNWVDFYWKINTSRREANRVRGAALETLGGTLEGMGMSPCGSLRRTNASARTAPTMIAVPSTGASFIANAGDTKLATTTTRASTTRFATRITRVASGRAAGSVPTREYASVVAVLDTRPPKKPTYSEPRVPPTRRSAI